LRFGPVEGEESKPPEEEEWLRRTLTASCVESEQLGWGREEEDVRVAIMLAVSARSRKGKKHRQFCSSFSSQGKRHTDFGLKPQRDAVPEAIRHDGDEDLRGKNQQGEGPKRERNGETDDDEDLQDLRMKQVSKSGERGSKWDVRGRAYWSVQSGE
jgi:hypothetical protein